MKHIYVLVLSVIVIGSIVFLMASTSEGKLHTDYQAPTNEELAGQTYGVVVIGGEPEGVAAAVAAARNGANTLLIEKRDGLGGLMTYGMLNYIDLVNGIGGDSAVAGIFKEWHDLVGGDVAFDIERGKDAFMHLVLSEPNLTLTLDTTVEDAVMEGSTVVGAKVERHGDVLELKGKRFIDATQDGDLAVMAGAPYYQGGADHNLGDRQMAVTLMMHFKNVNWSGIKQAARDGLFRGGETTPTVAWGFNDLAYEYNAVEENTRLRGLNIVRTTEDDGTEGVIINALQIFGVDGTNPADLKAAIEKGKRETEHVLTFLRKEFPGFEEAEIASYPDELYVRETRHIESEYMLKMKDIWTHTDFWDGIAFGGYPVDVQATDLSNYGYIISAPTQYAIPFRSTVPLKVENLLVVSRSAGYTSLAAGSARIIPTGMAVGEAGGTAAPLSIERGMTFREMSKSEVVIESLRETLAKQGAKVEHFDIGYPYEGEWFDEAVQYLINFGVVTGGYKNDLEIESDLNRLHMANILSNGLERSNKEAYNKYASEIQVANMEDPTFKEGSFTRDEFASYLVEVFGDGANVSATPWDQALELGLIDEEIYERLGENVTLKRKHGYYIAAQLLQKYSE
ncbi:FAD-dependent oxidoreductase [Filobacillus milosensis]|uniref:FAD-dependent oxidoreductase n=1 Tax=Filobacillus milosensis TaxID=94137 RepID=A0A4Y8IFS3_9BACI|nr:FAD-dependent oxidoreductase [Filobacillus milosensis]TFB19281.1 FAD-dependent oxidoreductase [Filobacillus milosensis]